MIVAVGNNPDKKTLFTIEERVALLKKVIDDTGLKNVRVDYFEGLQVNYARAQAQVIVKGLRALSDFEYEFQMALTNKNWHRSLKQCL